MKTYLQLILDCFAVMDIDGLRLYLKDEFEYQNTSKEVFLDKIEVLFEKLKKSGDSSLKVSAGTCKNSECNPDSIRSGYRFIGNHSKNFFDLRVITSGDGLDQAIDIIDIFDCDSFDTFENTGELGEKFSVLIYFDEEVRFYKSPEFLIYRRKALESFEELFTTPIKTVKLETVENWLSLNRLTADYILENDSDLEILSWMRFSYEYGWLDSLLQTIQNLNQADIQLVIENDAEERLIEKILHIEMILETGYNFCRVLQKEGRSYSLNYCKMLLIVGNEINKIGGFLVEIFQPLQKSLVEKYFALTEDEIDKILELEDLEETDLNLDLLSTHLNIREKAKMNGEWIPYYLGKDKNAV